MDKSILKLIRDIKAVLSNNTSFRENSLLGKILNCLTYEEFMSYYWFNKLCILLLDERNIKKIINQATAREVYNMLKFRPWFIEFLNNPSRKQIRYALRRDVRIIPNLKAKHVPASLVIELFERSIRLNYINPLNYMKNIPVEVQNHIIRKKHLIDISRFTDENKIKAVVSDFRYLVLYDPDTENEYVSGNHAERLFYTFKNYEKTERLLNIMIDIDPIAVEKLCTEHVPLHGIGLLFRGNTRFSDRIRLKCVNAYPSAIEYLNHRYIAETDEYELDIDLIEHAVKLDGETIRFCTDPSYELCEMAVRSTPRSILWILKMQQYSTKNIQKNPNRKNELAFLKILAIQLNPDLVHIPLLSTKKTRQFAELCKRRKQLNLMLNLCLPFHELNLPDTIMYLIFDYLHDHDLTQHDMWNVTRIPKKQGVKV